MKSANADGVVLHRSLPRDAARIIGSGGRLSAQALAPDRAGTPGSAFELNGRCSPRKWAKPMGQPFVTENRAGASGMIGTEAVARAAPDGYTMLWATPAFLVSTVFMIKKLPFDPRKDFAPISDGAEPITMQILHRRCCRQCDPVHRICEENPGKLSYGHTGIGTVFHLMAKPSTSCGNHDRHVPYKGPPQSLQDLVRDDPDHVDHHRLRHAAVQKRQDQDHRGQQRGSPPALPDVP